MAAMFALFLALVALVAGQTTTTCTSTTTHTTTATISSFPRPRLSSCTLATFSATPPTIPGFPPPQVTTTQYCDCAGGYKAALTTSQQNGTPYTICAYDPFPTIATGPVTTGAGAQNQTVALSTLSGNVTGLVTTTIPAEPTTRSSTATVPTRTALGVAPTHDSLGFMMLLAGVGGMVAALA